MPRPTTQDAAAPATSPTSSPGSAPKPTGPAAGPRQLGGAGRFLAPVDSFEPGTAPAQAGKAPAGQPNAQPVKAAGPTPAAEPVKPAHEVEKEKFLANTAGFRDTLKQGRDLEAQIAKLPANSPELPKLKEQLAQTDKKLKDSTGYTLATAPKPGELWIDPTQMKAQLPGGKVDAKTFPTKAPVTKPPSPEEALFAGGKTFSLTGSDGKEHTFKNMDEYKKYVADAREKAGMPRKDGDPVGVHLVMEGGGGLGKRYGPATSQMYELGVVPTSVAGTSVGSIAAAYIAAGGDPKGAEQFMKVASYKGNLSDAEAYNTFNKALQDLTGIKDRPVTFADLKMPLQITAATGEGGISNKTPVVFSQETTPNTPVALAVRSSMAVPEFLGVTKTPYTPVRMVDPVTGEGKVLSDGGTADNFPLGSKSYGLPTVGLALTDPMTGHPSYNRPSSWHPVKDDLPARSQPKDNQFLLSLPSWDLTKPDQKDDVYRFEREPLDDKLDPQTRQVTRDFFKKTLGDIGTNPKAKATNVPALPKQVAFDQKVTANGVDYQATYDSSKAKEKKGAFGFGSPTVPVTFTGPDGKSFTVDIEKPKLEAMYLDGKAFGGLDAYLRPLLEAKLKAAEKKQPMLKAG